jgi:hypothetical protein
MSRLAQVLMSGLSKLGLLKLKVSTAEELRKGLEEDLLELAKRGGGADFEAVRSLATSAVLEAIAGLAKYQPHAFLNAYLEFVSSSTEHGNGELIANFSAAFRSDWFRDNQVGWIPRELTAVVDSQVFGTAGIHSAETKATSFFMAQLFVEHYVNVLKQLRLPNGKVA